MSKDVFVLVECKEGAVRKVSLEILSKGRDVAETLSGVLYAVVAGYETGEIGDSLKSFADKVIIVDNEALKEYRWDVYVDVMEYLVKKYSPYMVLGGSTIRGKDLFPRLAARLGRALVSDAVGIRVENDRPEVKKPLYGGKVISWVAPKDGPGLCITFRPNSFSVEKRPSEGELIAEAVDVKMDGRLTLVGVDKGTSKKIDLQEADFIICGGRGMRGPENFQILEEIADIMGGRVGASRAVVDAKWREYEDQVGKSGKTVSPKLYVGCGISGALHHTMGMDTSKIIVAINKDPNAPIFQYADYGVVADGLEVLPILRDELKRIKEER
jgi:electron transfer flavoprotein alpha subunit